MMSGRFIRKSLPVSSVSFEDDTVVSRRSINLASTALAYLKAPTFYRFDVLLNDGNFRHEKCQPSCLRRPKKTRILSSCFCVGSIQSFSGTIMAFFTIKTFLIYPHSSIIFKRGAVPLCFC